MRKALVNFRINGKQFAHTFSAKTRFGTLRLAVELASAHPLAKIIGWEYVS